MQRGRRGAGGDRRRREAAAAGPQQGRPARARRSAARSRSRHPDAVLVSALDGEGPRRAARADRDRLRGDPDRGRAADPLRAGRRACTSCTRSPATSSGPTARTASSSTPGSRPPSCTASTISPSPSPSSRLRAVELPVAKLNDGAVLPTRGPRGRRRARPLRLRGRPHRARRALERRHRDRGRDPRRARRPGPAALGPRPRARDRPGQQPRPDRRRLPRRGAGPAAQHRPGRDLPGRARRPDRPAGRSPRSRSPSRSRSTRSPSPPAATAASAPAAAERAPAALDVGVGEPAQDSIARSTVAPVGRAAALRSPRTSQPSRWRRSASSVARARRRSG